MTNITVKHFTKCAKCTLIIRFDPLCICYNVLLRTGPLCLRIIPAKNSPTLAHIQTGHEVSSIYPYFKSPAFSKRRWPVPGGQHVQAGHRILARCSICYDKHCVTSLQACFGVKGYRSHWAAAPAMLPQQHSSLWG